MKKIKLLNAKYALVDDSDFDELNKFEWHTDAKGYAVRSNGLSKGKQRQVRMHREIMNTPKGMDTDHIDHDKLNNQRDNLRVCTNSQNQMNRVKPAHGVTSKFKGVSVWISDSFKNRYIYKYYKASLWGGRGGKRISKLFPFTPEGEKSAAKWWNEMAKQHYGEFVSLNRL